MWHLCFTLGWWEVLYLGSFCVSVGITLAGYTVNVCVCVLCLCIIICLFCMTQISCLCLCPFCLGWHAVGREKGFTYKNYFVLLRFKLTILGTCWNSLVSDLLATLVPFSFAIRSRDISGFFQFRHEFPVLQGETCESPTANCTRKKTSLLTVVHVFHVFIGVTIDISSSKLFPY